MNGSMSNHRIMNDLWQGRTKGEGGKGGAGRGGAQCNKCLVSGLGTSLPRKATSSPPASGVQEAWDLLMRGKARAASVVP